jgi:hypothetical protein
MELKGIGKNLAAYSKEIGKGGVAGAAAIVAYDRFLSTPIQGALAQAGGKALGPYVSPVGAFLVSLGIKYLARNASPAWKQAAHDAAVSLVAHKFATAFAGGPLDPPSPAYGAGTLAQPTRWQSLQSQPISVSAT